MAPVRPVVHLWRLGRMRYDPALRVQQGLAGVLKEEAMARKKAQEEGRHRERRAQPHALIVVEHEPVYTTGIRTESYSSDEERRLRSLGADFVRADRGGLITFHGPGQLVAYPVLDLREFVPEAAAKKALLGMKWYLHQLEEAVMATCSSLGVEGSHRSPDTGVWLGPPGSQRERKVCAMGVRNSGFVTTHGLALNCDTDMSWFSHIVPCGIEGKGVTSLSLELGRRMGTEEALPPLVENFERALSCRVVDERPEGAERILEEAHSKEDGEERKNLKK